MIQKSPLLILLAFSMFRAASAQVLMEVPLLLEVPGREGLIRAWYDGDLFLVDAADLFQALGFTVHLTEVGIEVVDAHSHYTFSCVSVPEHHSCRVLMNDVLDRLGSALHFDQHRLHLTASSIAATFDVRALRKRQRSWKEVPGPNLFGRTRRFWGGAMVSWQLRRDAFGVHPSLRLTGSALLGTVEADLDHGHSWVYRYDRSQSTWLTQIEAGRFTNGVAGVFITNSPLAGWRLHRVRSIRGQSAPHALVQAVISGEVVDQVQADVEGNYELSTPAWYGTTKLEVQTQRLGGQRMLSKYQYLLTPTSLVPPGKAYYQLHASEQNYTLNFQYGVHQRMTLRSGLTHVNEHMEVMAGFTLSPVTFLSVGTEVLLPEVGWLTTLQMWRSGVQVTAHIDVRQNGFLSTNVVASVSKGQLSMLLRGTQLAQKGHGHHLSLHPEIWLHHHGGLLMQGSWGFDRQQGQSVAGGIHHRWYFAAGWSFPQMRALGFAEQDYLQTSYGLEGILMRRHSSLGFSIGWDADHKIMIGRLSFQLSSPVGSLFARGHRDVHGGAHSQQVQGSMHFWRGVTFAPSMNQESAAELRIFEDINGDGRQDPTEPILPHIDVQLYQGGWTRLKTGALYAAHLEPYQQYQIQILDASIRDPSLHPATGLEFSFTADPGQRKIIRVPMQRLVPVRGKITGLDRAPLRLRVLLDQAETAEVYRDGGFAFHVRPGHYILTVMDILNQNTLAEKMVEVGTGPVHTEIDLERDRR